MLTRSLAGLSSFAIYLLFWFSRFLDVEHEDDPYQITALGEVANERIKDGTFLSWADAATLTCLRYETRAETVVRTQWPIVFGVNESVTMLPLYLCTNLCSSRSSPCCFSLVRLDAPYNYSLSLDFLSLSVCACGDDVAAAAYDTQLLLLLASCDFYQTHIKWISLLDANISKS